MVISLVVPVYNEEKILEDSVKKLSVFLKSNISGEFQIIISDNASTDKTSEIAKKLAEEFFEIKYLRLEQKGKGLAIAEGWRRFPVEPPLIPRPKRPGSRPRLCRGLGTPPIPTLRSEQGENVGVYMFMDADLSCGLADIPKFAEAIKFGYNIACGSRHLKDSKDNRPFVRKLISKIWSLISKLILGTKLTDTACGIKAVNQKVIDVILPKIKNHQWFFDSELVLRAEKEGYNIVEIPVKWTENKNRKSKVSFFKVGWEYIRNLIRLKSEIRNHPL